MDHGGTRTDACAAVQTAAAAAEWQSMQRTRHGQPAADYTAVVLCVASSSPFSSLPVPVLDPPPSLPPSPFCLSLHPAFLLLFVIILSHCLSNFAYCLLKLWPCNAAAAATPAVVLLLLLLHRQLLHCCGCTAAAFRCGGSWMRLAMKVTRVMVMMRGRMAAMAWRHSWQHSW